MSSGNRESYFEQAYIASNTIHYWRGFQRFMNKNGQTYLRGHMAVRDRDSNPNEYAWETIDEYVWFDTIERMDGTPWLRPGMYRATMEISIDPKNPGRRQIRPIHAQRNTEDRICNFLIHPSKPPHFLTGCVAPGIQTPSGIDHSEKALKKIFRCLGGFEAGKRVSLRVDGRRPAN